MPHTTYTESTLALGRVGGSRRRARAEHRREQRPNSQRDRVSAEQARTPRDRRRGSGTPEHRREQRPNKQTVPSTRNVHTLRYLHDTRYTYDIKYRTCLSSLESNRHLHVRRWGMQVPWETMGEALVAPTARLPSAPLSRVPASLDTFHETVCFAARKQTVSLIQVTN